MAMKEPSATQPRRRRAVLDLPACGLGAITIAGFAGRWHWMLDLASHFRWYYLLAALAWYAITSRRRSRFATACLAVAVAANLWVIAPYWIPARGAPVDGERLSVVAINLHVENTDRTRVVTYLRDRNPDVFACVEVDEDWAATLRVFDSAYPYRIVQAQRGHFGVAIYSRVPLDEPAIVEVAGGTPMAVAGLARGQKGCVIVAAHPRAPLGASWTDRRDEQLAAIGNMAAEERRPIIVMGDLNTTPWSHGYRALVRPRGLRDTALGRGVQGSWNARYWAPRIPIDHILVSPEIGVEARTLGPDVGSDHLPVEATLVVP